MLTSNAKKNRPALWTTTPAQVKQREADAARRKGVKAALSALKRGKAAARAVERRKSRPRAFKRVAPRSAKRVEEGAVYARLRADFLMVRCRCERCGLPSTEVHHKAGRGRHYLEVATWAALCSGCHRWVHDHPDAARAEGWLPMKGGWA